MKWCGTTYTSLLSELLNGRKEVLQVKELNKLKTSLRAFFKPHFIDVVICYTLKYCPHWIR